MTEKYKNMISPAYEAFNARNIDAVLTLLHSDVQWSNGWEGGYVNGHDQIREYWTRQWKEINPAVKPVSFEEKNGNQLEVKVHQLVKDMQGNVMFDGTVKHIYTIENGLIKRMDIE